MSFWNLSTGNVDTSGTFDMGGGDMEPIPANTQCLAMIDEAKWDEKEGNRYVSLRWSVLQPMEYKNRKVFQKLWVSDPDPSAKDPVKKRDKAVQMLAAIDANASGGKLMARDEAPTDTSLTQCLTQKPMLIKVMTWKIEDKVGNWIGQVEKKASKPSPEVPF